ncbi:thioredoxin family protein [Mangrovimonas sp. YM274]|uniref:thioredoxin family protein n=1 Tax=Mangrovimonas sp. YM274 TaxID=3070660 RepID=UPI0027DE4812|nr:thioredoxin family protein [Mangrovimonas sp. YM274]WMI69989.1 thioredoxin family protein [Mangrovimonas sp. YM274]
MRKLLVLLLFILGVNSVFSQEWQTNFEEAKSQAAKEHKSIVLIFSGSDWCAPCIKLEKQILETEQFKSFANERAVLVRADFPRKKQNQLDENLQNQNKHLAEMYNQQGYFPLVVVMSPEGKVLGQAGYEKTSPEAYVAKLKGFMK